MKHLQWKNLLGMAVFILCTQGTHTGRRVEDHIIMFTEHSHLPQ